MGVAEAREAGTFGVLVHFGFQHDVAKLVEGTAGRTHKIYLFGVGLQERRPAGARGGSPPAGGKLDHAVATVQFRPVWGRVGRPGPNGRASCRERAWQNGEISGG